MRCPGLPMRICWLSCGLANFPVRITQNYFLLAWSNRIDCGISSQKAAVKLAYHTHILYCGRTPTYYCTTVENGRLHHPVSFACPFHSIEIEITSHHPASLPQSKYRTHHYSIQIRHPSATHHPYSITA